jgi:predicted ATPase
VRSQAERAVLIVLDNCEHVRVQAAGLVVAMTGQCPRARVITTSRERLDVPGEFVFPVPPLGLPEDGSARAVAASKAGSLFAERAHAALREALTRLPPSCPSSSRTSTQVPVRPV